MFQSLRPNSIFYILDKGDTPTLKTASVVSVSNPVPKYPSNYAQPQFGETTVDVKIRMSDGSEADYQKLPSAMSIANFGNGIVVSESREAMCAEVEAMQRVSQGVIDSVDYHKRILESCNDFLKTLNPQFAKDRQTEEDINILKTEMDGVKSTLSDIHMMLQKMNGTK